MSDSLRLYRTIIEMIWNSQVRFHDIRCLITFTWAIAGVILERSVHLSRWSVHRSGEAQAASKQRQFARWLKNTKSILLKSIRGWHAWRLRNGKGKSFIWLWTAAVCGINLFWYG